MALVAFSLRSRISGLLTAVSVNSLRGREITRVSETGEAAACALVARFLPFHILVVSIYPVEISLA